jgi:hypothetical protein
MSVCGTLRGSAGTAAGIFIGIIGALVGPSDARAASAPTTRPTVNNNEAAVATDPYVSVLTEQAITPDVNGIVTYLRGLTPTPQNRKLVRSLIVQLGSMDFARRELAARQLIAMPVVPPEELTAAAADGDDAETRLRAQQVMAARAAGNASSSVAVACFRTIARRKLTGAAPAVLDVLPLYGEEFVLAAARDALRVTSRPEDAALLRKTIGGGSLEARVAAIGALAAVTGGGTDASSAFMRGLLNDPEARVKLAAARALADRGDRKCLATLVDLLTAHDVRVRHASASLLRALTGRRSEYAAWVEPDAQPAALQDWRDWLAADGATATLTYPVGSAEPESGRTILCLYSKNEIVELDAAGHQTFAASEPGGCPWAAEGLASGGRLVALYSTNTVVEYAPDGRERARIPVPGGPMSVRRLDNGNTLVACNNAQKVVEVDEHGKIHWELSACGGPCDAVRLDNGHTLVTLQNANAVVEYDSGGKEVWRIEGLRTPRSASRLEDGNTLVCDLGSGRVVEFDPSGNEAWSQGGFTSPFAAQRLTSGTTLVSDTQAVKEIDREGKVISEVKQQALGRVWRY